LTVAQVLAWAESHHARTGRWPKRKDGLVRDALGEDWFSIDQYLRKGLRGLPGGRSLAKLLRDERGVRNPRIPPDLTEARILAWAQAHRRRTGRWPAQASGPLAEAPCEVWGNLDAALREGRRGLPGGSSLARLLESRLDVRNPALAPPLTEADILSWADAHHAREGRWPRASSGPVAAAPGETWARVDDGLRQGHRGLPGGSSLARLLERERGARNVVTPPPLTEELILSWADDHFRRTGRWPTRRDGPVRAAPGETWEAMHSALAVGRRGLPRGSSLKGLLTHRRGAGAPEEGEDR
jgi:hypothetical protein